MGVSYFRCEEKSGPGEGSFSNVGIHYTGPSAENSPEPTKGNTQVTNTYIKNLIVRYISLNLFYN